MVQVPPLLLALLLCQADVAEPVTRPAEDPERTQQRLEIERELAGLKRHQPLRVDQLLEMKLVDGQLAVRPLIEPTDGRVAIDMIGWPGLTTVRLGERQDLHFRHIDFSKPGEIVTYTEVFLLPGHLQVCRTSEGRDHSLSVTLIQSPLVAQEGDPIRVLVQATSEVGGPDFTAKLRFDSFEALRTTGEPSLRAYLLPVLSDLGAASLLCVSDPRSAWQVLGDGIDPSPDVTRRVAGLIERLSAEDFATRVAAQDELGQAGPELAAALARVDLSRLDIDARATLGNFIRAQRPLPDARVKALADDKEFLLDTLLLEEAALREAARDRLARISGQTIELPASLEPEQRAERIEQLRRQLIPTTQPAE